MMSYSISSVVADVEVEVEVEWRGGEEKRGRGFYLYLGRQVREDDLAPDLNFVSEILFWNLLNFWDGRHGRGAISEDHGPVWGY